MKSFGEYFSSLLNLNMFCKSNKSDSTDSLNDTVHESKTLIKDDVQETTSEKCETSVENEEEQKKNETFEFIEIAESSFDEEVEDMFITKF